MSTCDFVRVFRRSRMPIRVTAVPGGLVATHFAAPTKRVFAATSLAYVGREAGGMRNQVTRGNLFRKRRVSTYANLPPEPIMTASIIDPDREGTSGLPNDWHQNLTDTHRAQTAQTSDAPDSTMGTVDAEEGGLPAGNAIWHDDQRGRAVTLPFPSTTGG